MRILDIKNILNKVDHTLLKTDATWEKIKAICDDGINYETASVCIPPYFVRYASEYVCGKVKICTVIGFPNGYSTSEVKCFEAKDAVLNGSDEIDMVVNIGLIKSKQYDAILKEINEVKNACDGRVLKVIVETCILSDEEKVMMCETISNSNADFIKTSTGFSTNGATFEDIELFSKHISNNKKIKAAGGIKTLQDAQRFIDLGASRLGTSSIIKIIKNENIEIY